MVPTRIVKHACLRVCVCLNMVYPSSLAVSQVCPRCSPQYMCPSVGNLLCVNHQFHKVSKYCFGIRLPGNQDKTRQRSRVSLGEPLHRADIMITIHMSRILRAYEVFTNKYQASLQVIDQTTIVMCPVLHNDNGKWQMLHKTQ